MTVDERKKVFDAISHVLAITRYDIEHHQSINDLSLNIHGENYFRDVFNHVYGLNLQNANFESFNFPSIDLIDKGNKIAYQITTTKSKEKIDKTLEIYNREGYEDYEVRILYLLEKAQPKPSTVTAIQSKYGIDITSRLFDYTDLIRDIEQLEGVKLQELHRKYFSAQAERYTDEIALDLIIKHLLKEKATVKINYDDVFGTVDANQKLELNSIIDRTEYEIKKGLDYRQLLDRLDADDSFISNLRELIIDKLYKDVLLQLLERVLSKAELMPLSTNELQFKAQENGIDFNKAINNLREKIEAQIEIQDFNSMSISWIIIAYFFELCDVGVDRK